MFVVMVASECALVAQAGGLGDVVFGLGRELELRGNAVEIILPKYDCLRYDRIYGLHPVYEDLWVPWFGGAVHCTVYFGFVEGRKCFFIEPHSPERFFERGHIYGSHDDTDRFAFFSKAALEFMLKSGKRPDIIHCHDWQTALVPVLLFDMYQHAQPPVGRALPVARRRLPVDMRSHAMGVSRSDRPRGRPGRGSHDPREQGPSDDAIRGHARAARVRRRARRAARRA